MANPAQVDAHQDGTYRTVIEGTEISWEFYDSKGNVYSWSMPIDTYESQVAASHRVEPKPVEVTNDGQTLTVISLDGFVKESFVEVIDSIYDNSEDNPDFIWEVWYVVSQLTVADQYVDEYSEGRYALETFTRTGGDCEDLVILVADMLMSSRHTDDWTFQYVYMDSDNPTDPQTANYVILAVSDGEYTYYIDAAAPPRWDYYPEGVAGWWFDVVTYGTGAEHLPDTYRTIIKDTEISWEFYDSKGNIYFWSMPVITYEAQVAARQFERNTVDLQTDDGQTFSSISLDGFVLESFTNVIDSIYDNSENNSDFVWEVWYVVSRLTVYDEDVDEYSEGRYALETFTRTGGDCEDLVILVADMLMSSRHTDDWTFQYVYMDSDNPTDPQTVNHIILSVDDGEYGYLVEATGPPSWDYFPEGVRGWWFDVATYGGAGWSGT